MKTTFLFLVWSHNSNRQRRHLSKARRIPYFHSLCHEWTYQGAFKAATGKKSHTRARNVTSLENFSSDLGLKKLYDIKFPDRVQKLGSFTSKEILFKMARATSHFEMAPTKYFTNTRDRGIWHSHHMLSAKEFTPSQKFCGRPIHTPRFEWKVRITIKPSGCLAFQNFVDFLRPKLGTYGPDRQKLLFRDPFICFRVI